MNSVIVAALVTLFVASAIAETCERNGAKCPDYTVVHTFEDYEERLYPSLVWVSASDDGVSRSNVSRRLVKQLYTYFGGENDAGEKFDMIVPFRTKKEIKEGYNTYTLSIALLPSRSENPPQPTNPNLRVTREPAKTYVARSFGGQARQDIIWDGHARVLKEATENDNSVDSSYYYMCVYDSPWRETDRLNEVWMEKSEN